MEKPLTEREIVATRRAGILAPYVIRAVARVAGGHVKYTPEKVREIFETIGAMAPLIDSAPMEETDRLALNAVFSFIMRIESSGQLTERRLKIALAMFDQLKEFIDLGLTFLEVEDPDPADEPELASIGTDDPAKPSDLYPPEFHPPEFQG